MFKEEDVTEVGTVFSVKVVYDHKFFRVLSVVFQTPGYIVRDPQLLWDRSDKEYVVALLRKPNGKWVFVCEPKYGAARMIVTAPTGLRKPSETGIEAAIRFAKTKAGYTASQWTCLTPTSCPEFADKIAGGEHVIYLGEGAIPEDTHGKEVLQLSTQEVLALACKGRVQGMTLAAMSFVFMAESANS